MAVALHHFATAIVTLSIHIAVLVMYEVALDKQHGCTFVALIAFNRAPDFA